MTCTDCIHYDVCHFHITEETNMTVNECSHAFKDKSKIIELPCNLNDTLYHYKTVCKKQGRKKAEETIIEPISIDRFIIAELGVPQAECCNNDNEWVTYGADDIGKTVFLTKEDAEKALEAKNHA